MNDEESTLNCTKWLGVFESALVVIYVLHFFVLLDMFFFNTPSSIFLNGYFVEIKICS